MSNTIIVSAIFVVLSVLILIFLALFLNEKDNREIEESIYRENEDFFVQKINDLNRRIEELDKKTDSIKEKKVKKIVKKEKKSGVK